MDNNEVLLNIEYSEYPFARKGMTYGEYNEEVRYFAEHRKEYREGTYKPLWKQRELGLVKTNK